MEIVMKNFVSEVKKINTDRLIYKFSEISIEMFKNNQCMRKVEIPVIRYGKRQKLIVQLSAWDIPNIVYLSVKESNDYRQADKVASIEQLVDLYREYDNEHSAAESIKNADVDEVFRVILGMTAEQFQYQNLWWIFEKFNRDYYMLLAAKNFEHRSEIDINAVVKEVFGYSADDYVAILLMVFWLCSQHPDPLSAPENLYCRKIFEDYIKDLATNYFESSKWDILSAGVKKGADFVFDFGSLQMLIESKSSLLKLDVKQQVPNLKSTDTFFNRTISEAYAQLNSSYAQINGKVDVPVIKIILLYDEFSNTAIIESSKREIFEKDPLCFVMTIRELEILLYFHRNDKVKEQQILDALLDSIKSDGVGKNIGAIYNELSIYKNPHLDGEMDYFSKAMKYFGNNLQ